MVDTFCIHHAGALAVSGVLLAAVDLPPIEHPVYLIALAAALVVGVIALRPTIALGQGPSAAWAPGDSGAWRGVLTVLGVGGLTILCYQVIVGLRWPPVSSEHRVGWAIAMTTAIAVVFALSPVRRAIDPAGAVVRASRLPAWLWVKIIAAILAKLMVIALMWNHLLPNAESWAGLLQGIATVTACVLMTLALTSIERRGGGLSSAIILAGVVLASSAALLASGSIVLGQIGLGLAAVSLALAIAAVIKKNAPIAPLAIALASAIITALLLAGYRFSSLPLRGGVVLAAAPVAGWAAGALVARRVSPRWRHVIEIVVSAITAGIGVALCVNFAEIFGEPTQDAYAP